MVQINLNAVFVKNNNLYTINQFMDTFDREDVSSVFIILNQYFILIDSQIYAVAEGQAQELKSWRQSN